MTSTMRSLERLLSPRCLGAIFGCVAVVAVDACDLPPTGPQNNTDQRTCDHGGDTSWTSTGAQLTLVDPKCPLTLKAYTDNINYATTVTMPQSSADPDFTPTVGFVVTDILRNNVVADGGQSFMQPDDQNSSLYRVDESAYGNPGLYTDPANSAKFFDSLSVNLNGIDRSRWEFGQAVGFQHLPGVISSVSPSLSGPTSVAAYSGATYTMKPDWNTTGYAYQWIVDGTPASGSQTYDLGTQFTSLGNHTVTGVATRSDNTSDTVSMSVNVPFTVSISGPYQINQYDNGTWTAAVPAGVPPYSYTWYVDDVQQSETSNTFTSTVSDNGGSHTVMVNVNDSGGHSAGAQEFVEVIAPGCDPTQITCNRRPVAKPRLPSRKP